MTTIPPRALVPGTRPRRAARAGALVGLALAACGGDYSNEDLDFQGAVPRRDTIAPQMRALVRADSAEYYLFTQAGVRDFGRLRDGILGGIDQVRSQPPSQRQGETRTWGPWRDLERPGMQQRVVMERLADASAPRGFKFAWRLEMARLTAPEWVAYVRGEFQPAGGVQRGTGRIDIVTAGLRRLGVALDRDPRDDDPELSWLDTMTIQYRSQPPVAWQAEAVAFAGDPAAPPDARAAHWAYREYAGGGAAGAPADTAEFRFAFDGAPNLWLQAAQVVSTWRLSDHAGRADLTVTEGLAAGLAGTDCWDASTRATYTRRDWAREQDRGDPASCVFPAAR